MFILPSCEQVCLNKRQRISLTFKGESVGFTINKTFISPKAKESLRNVNV